MEILIRKPNIQHCVNGSNFDSELTQVNDGLIANAKPITESINVHW